MEPHEKRSPLGAPQTRSQCFWRRSTIWILTRPYEFSLAWMLALTTMSWDVWTSKSDKEYDKDCFGTNLGQLFFAETAHLLSLARKESLQNGQRETLRENLVTLYVLTLHGQMHDRVFWREHDIVKRWLSEGTISPRSPNSKTSDGTIEAAANFFVDHSKAIEKARKDSRSLHPFKYRINVLEYVKHWLNKLSGSTEMEFATIIHLVRLNLLCRLDLQDGLDIMSADDTSTPSLTFLYPPEKFAPALDIWITSIPQGISRSSWPKQSISQFTRLYLLLLGFGHMTQRNG